MHLSTHPTSYPTRYQEIAAKLEQELRQHYRCGGNDSNLLIVFYVQIMPDDFVMQLHRF